MVRNILICEDEPAIRKLFEFALRMDGYEVVAVPDGESALAVLASFHFDLLLSDLALPGIDAFEVLGRVRVSQPELKVGIVSGLPAMVEAIRSRPALWDFVLEKPLSMTALSTAVRSLLGTEELASAPM